MGEPISSSSSVDGPSCWTNAGFVLYHYTTPGLRLITHIHTQTHREGGNISPVCVLCSIHHHYCYDIDIENTT